MHAIDKLNGDDEFWSRMRANFTDTEIGDIGVMAGMWLGTGYALKALGIGSVCPMPVNEEMLARLRNDKTNISAV